MKTDSLYSMTGFGTAEFRLPDGTSYRAEFRSLNHRSLDFKLRLPRDWMQLELQVRAWVAQKITRGSVDLRIEAVGSDSKKTTQWKVNRAQLESLLKDLTDFRSDRALEIGDVSPMLSLPDVLERTSSEVEPEILWKALERGMSEAAKNLIDMRAREGSDLAKVLLKTIDTLLETTAWAKERRDVWRKELEPKIREKVKLLFETYAAELKGADTQIETRVALELAAISDRTDFEEEVVRLEGHLHHFKSVVDSGGPAGRKLEFILQEMHRELNTLANKAQDLKISGRIIESKLLVEQLKEQVLNIA